MSATEERGEADGAGFARGDRARRGAARRGAAVARARRFSRRVVPVRVLRTTTRRMRVASSRSTAGNARAGGVGARREGRRGWGERLVASRDPGRDSRAPDSDGARAGAVARRPRGRRGVGKRAPGADIIRYAPTTRRASAPPVASRRGSTPRGAARRTPRGSFVGSRPRAARSARRSGGTRPGPERGNPPRWRCHGARDKEKTRESLPTGGA